MPLSEHEQRLLEQIEQALYAEDPKFASAVRSSDLRSHYRRRLTRCTILFLLGLGLLVAGVVLKMVAMGVGGFVVMLTALTLGVTFTQRLFGRRGAPRPQAARRPGLLARLEARWQRRWEQRGR